MNNITPINAARAPQLDSHNLAIAVLWRHRWENRVTALANCIEHLVTVHDMTEAAAELAAIQAYADLESENTLATIDMDASTSHIVVMRTEGGRPAMFTVSDLLRILGQARDEGRAVVVDRESHRPVVLEH
ncbi:hypothetical protein [Halomonas salipaludis]|uniref:Uncharacterized protein n=1 Tax=Halomonas salipaludis TaxID=2032625 RepID=A0A2A2EWK3_9GAMM|nr:hypothetical protein [Halomonas salipaludis]PAU76759.1 hypothetical protein CK498_12320 [Halomonas salipaludis]